MYRNRISHWAERGMKPCHPYGILTFITFLSGITGARLTTSPTQITIGGINPTSQLTVSCSPDSPVITTVHSIEIGKKSSTGSIQPITRMSNADSSVQVVDTGLQQRITASGSITGATSSLQFVLTDLRCVDAASTYYCSILYRAGSTESDEATTNITARTYPEQIQMFPTPDRVSYDEGQMILFRCTGRIGNQFDVNNLQNLWTWEWRSIDNEFTSWTRYPNDQNITYEPPIPVSGSRGCQYTGASTLLHTVSNLDNGRQFRCSVISEDHSDNKTVYIIGQQPRGPTSRPETSTTGLQPLRPTSRPETSTTGLQPRGPTSRPETSTTGQQPRGPTSRPETSTTGQQPRGPTSRPETSTTGQQLRGQSSRPETSTTGDDSLGVGVAIGVGVMMAVIVICLSLTFIYRNTVAGWLSGAKKASNTDTPVMSNIQTPATATAPVGMQTQGDEYEIPADRNHYDALQTETADIPNTYEKIRTYQNM